MKDSSLTDKTPLPGFIQAPRKDEEESNIPFDSWQISKGPEFGLRSAQLLGAEKNLINFFKISMTFY